MVNFGEKIKQLREEKGMTQQSLAEKLYVTRQAVSRWECGARYPDLLTAKKIAQVLEVSVDELLSGEELQENLENTSIPEKPAEHWIQTALYAIVAVPYLIICIFEKDMFTDIIKSLFVGRFGYGDYMTLGATVSNMLIFAAGFVGLIMSARRRLGAKMTGCVMAVPCIASAFANIELYVWYWEMVLHGFISQGSVSGLVSSALIQILYAIYIWLFFYTEKRKLLYGGIVIICIYQFVQIVERIVSDALPVALIGVPRSGRSYIEDVIIIMYYLARVSLVFLLGYQAYIWNRKKRAAYKK